MKELSIEQLELLNGGGFRKTMSCISQVIGGMGTLAGYAAMGTIVAATPIGWALLIAGAASLAAGLLSDPSACDS